MISVITTIIICYFFTQIAGYGVHRLLHNKLTGRMFRSHKTHHWTLYPPSDFLSENYREVPIKDRPIYYYLIAMIIVGAFGYFILPIKLFVLSMFEMAIVALLNDWFHTQFHIAGHWLERYNWFMRLRELHLQHHYDEHTNLGIFSWFSDKLFKTYSHKLKAVEVRYY